MGSHSSPAPSTASVQPWSSAKRRNAFHTSSRSATRPDRVGRDQAHPAVHAVGDQAVAPEEELLVASAGRSSRACRRRGGARCRRALASPPSPARRRRRHPAGDDRAEEQVGGGQRPSPMATASMAGAKKSSSRSGSATECRPTSRSVAAGKARGRGSRRWWRGAGEHGAELDADGAGDDRQRPRPPARVSSPRRADGWSTAAAKASRWKKQVQGHGGGDERLLDVDALHQVAGWRCPRAGPRRSSQARRWPRRTLRARRSRPRPPPGRRGRRPPGARPGGSAGAGTPAGARARLAEGRDQAEHAGRRHQAGRPAPDPPQPGVVVGGRRPRRRPGGRWPRPPGAARRRAGRVDVRVRGRASSRSMMVAPGRSPGRRGGGGRAARCRPRARPTTPGGGRGRATARRATTAGTAISDTTSLAQPVLA